MPAAATSCPGGGRRSHSSATGSIDTTQKIAMPWKVSRQPAVAMKCWTIGGHTVPAR